MATSLPIAGAPAGTNAKVRSGWLVLLWSIVTFGIYSIYWWYTINRELADTGRVRGTKELGDNPTLSTLAFALGGFALAIPTIWTLVTTIKRIQRAERLLGTGKVMNGWLYAALLIFTLGIGAIVYLQMHQNAVVRAQAAGHGMLEGAAALPATSQAPRSRGRGLRLHDGDDDFAYSGSSSESSWDSDSGSSDSGGSSD
jgi:magnesium-transporting ATPase (P-type)